MKKKKKKIWKIRPKNTQFQPVIFGTIPGSKRNNGSTGFLKKKGCLVSSGPRQSRAISSTEFILI